MRHALFWLILLSLALFGYNDSDLDGVEDAFDSCLNTPFSDLVDAEGCSVASLSSSHRFDLVLGVAVSQKNKKTLADTTTVYGSLQFDYFYKDFTAVVTLGTYSDDNGSGLNDTTVGGYYRFYIDSDWSVSLGAGIILPTYDTALNNEAIDYSVSAELLYGHEAFSLFVSATYTFVNDSDVGTIRYQNTEAFLAGFGYAPTSLLYGSLSYYHSRSIYRDVEAVQNASLYIYYAFADPYFLTCSYAAGLSDSASDHSFSLRFGVAF